MLYCLTGHIYLLTRFMAIYLLLLLFVYNMEIYKYTLTWCISFGAINLSTHCKNDHYFKMIILSRWLAIVPSIVHCGIDPTSVLRLSNLSAKSSLYSKTSCCERFTTSNCSLFCTLSPRFELKKTFFFFYAGLYITQFWLWSNEDAVVTISIQNFVVIYSCFTRL